MASEDFTLVALPRSADPNRRFHASLFITPHLTPEAESGKLREFPRFKRWSEALAGAEIRLLGGTSTDGSGGHEIAATPLLDRLRPQQWRRVFPGTTPVRGRPEPELPEDLVSYPAHKVDQDALRLHAAALLQEPVDLPRPLGPALREIVALQLAFARPPGLEALRLDRIFDPKSKLQGKFTEMLDNAEELEHGIIGRTDISRMATVPGGLIEQLHDAHRAHRYYERLAPPPQTSVPSPPRPDPDFHERCALLAGTPRLLRWLGLVVDLRVDDLDELHRLSWIRGRIAIEGMDGGEGPARRPRTACYTRGRGFFARPAGDEWSDGWLRLSHPDGRYQVLDLDPDASALKLERHLRNLVRLAAAEQNGSPASGAPPALRAVGFSIARMNRKEQLAENLDLASRRAAAREQGADEPLELEELTRGLRLEVWDDVSEAWHSLHQRRVHIEAGGEQIADGVGDVGYLQGGALAQRVDQNGEPDDDAPPQLHEVIAGWQGWSLSAPPPGKTILDPEGTVGDPGLPAGAGDAVEIRSRVKQGTLPRLRYGRSYAFRVGSVDLAGNSSPHSLGEGAEPSPALQAALAPLLDLRAAPEGPSPFERELLATLRAARPLPEAKPAALAKDVGLEGALTGSAVLDRLILRRAAARAERRPAAAVTRRERIEHAFTRALHETRDALAATARDLDPTAAARLLGIFGELFDEPEELSEVVELYLDFVSKPRPFLRWDPVLPPTVVPRHRFSLGESLLTLVIRSGVEVSNVITISPPGDYTAANPGFGYRATSERHLAAPKSSQREAELHGVFDAAIGSGDAATRRAELAVALREEGTFSDKKIADLERPGKFVALDHVSKVGGPAAEGKAEYFVHDVDQATLPYLPDPLAVGVSLVFPDAGRDHRLEFPWSVEGLRLGYRRGWPEPRPYRLVLESGTRLEGRVEGNAIRIALPPGTELRLRSSSALRRDELRLLGLWRTRPPEYRGRKEIAEAAADGWLWWLTPYDEVRLVHAVPRPIEAPQMVGLEPRALLPNQRRDEDDTGCGLQGVIDLHAPSTGRVDLEASWREPVDDLTAEGPDEVAGNSTPWSVEVESEADFLVLLPQPVGGGTLILPDGDVVQPHTARHEFGDTKHRLVDYKLRGTTRFREHFDPALGVDDLSIVGASSRVNVPSSARPPKPVVRDILPLFRWGEQTEPEQPFALRRSRRSGLRIYLERPWHATGEGELLGVVLGPISGEVTAGTVPVSAWAADPVWKQRGPSSPQFLPLQDLLEAFEPELPDEPGRPVLAPRRLPVVDARGEPGVQVLGYRPEYNRERKLWFVDVAFDQGTAFWPFVQLALARFQPDSIDGKHMSPIVRCDFIQVAPDRMATLSRPDERHVRVVVTGAVGFPREIPNPRLVRGVAGTVTPAEERVKQSRSLRARLERRDPDLGGSDLGWAIVAQTDLELRGFENWTASWLGTLALPRAMAPRRPGSRPNWRVTVEEWERLRADPPPGAEHAPFRSEARLVYADHLHL